MISLSETLKDDDITLQTQTCSFIKCFKTFCFAHVVNLVLLGLVSTLDPFLEEDIEEVIDAEIQAESSVAHRMAVGKAVRPANTPARWAVARLQLHILKI